MSYCNARRHEAQLRVGYLEQRLKDARLRQQQLGDREEIARLREELEQALAELVTIGDCGD